MGEKKYYLTATGFQRKKEEYQRLMELRKEKKLKIKELRDELWRPEDLNPDYGALQTDLDFIEEKIKRLENILKNSKIIRKKRKPPKKVTLGTTVRIEINGEIDEFTIVETLEADPANKKISTSSPIGKALLGKEEGETITIKTPIVNHRCKILKIKYQ
ncbi:GreA/GreB family elongation factor [bacterium]|nr:GreA/GreB family elongation factor [bacterium]